MAGIDATIPLGYQQPDGMKTLSNIVGIRSAMQGQQLQQQNMQANAMANQQSQIDLQETQAAQGVMKNIKQYQDSDGNVDYNRLLPDMMKAAPKNGSKFVQNVMAMQQQATQAKQSWLTAGQQQRDAIGSIAGSLIDQDPQTAAKTFDAIASAPAYANMSLPIQIIQAGLHAAAKSGSKSAMNEVLKHVQQQAAPVAGQQPAVALVPTEGGTQPYNTNGLAPGGVGPMGAPMSPPNETIPTTSGGVAMVNKARGTVKPLASEGSPVDFPQGENKDTQAELQAQRTAAQQVASQAPVMHNLNRSILAEVDKGVSTGKWGEATQKIASTFGYKLSGDEATDYNVLGKLLERSALTASQSMGPHTNAGLEAQVRANGSTDYTPGAIRKIASLNDAMTTGASLYQQGLESSIGSGGLFSKRQFDQQWAGAMNPKDGVDGVQALRFKNAVDNGDQKELQAIVKEVGGPNSKGAKALHDKLMKLHSLAGVQ